MVLYKHIIIIQPRIDGITNFKLIHIISIGYITNLKLIHIKQLNINNFANLKYTDTQNIAKYRPLH